MNMNTKELTFKNIIIPNEIINIILSYRSINPVSIIFKNEYINSYNKKYIKNMKEIIIDLTYGSNRANYFIPVEINMIDDSIENNDTDNNTDNNTDNESYDSYIETDDSEVQTDNTELIYNTRTENIVFNGYYDNYENSEEHWALSNRNGTIQLQAMSCYFCGEYKITSNIIIPDKILCNC